MRNNCLHCGNDFYIKPSAVKRGRGKYCSKSCDNESRKISFSGEGNNQFGKHWMSGKDNPNWRGGKDTFNGHTWDFVQIAKMIRQRDDHKCQMCGCPQEEEEKELAVHHIDENKKNNDFNNLITLCNSCHCKIHRPHRYSMASKKGGANAIAT